MPLLLLAALTACFPNTTPTDSADTDPDDTGALVTDSADTGQDLPAFEPDPDLCLQPQLDANNPDRIYLPDGKAKLCLGLWLQEQHCYGRPVPQTDTIRLDFEPWAAWYGYMPGDQQGIFIRLVDYEQVDISMDYSLYNADLDVCTILVGVSPFTVDEQNPWTWDQWQGVAPDCTVDNMLRCRCDADGNPSDASCYDLNIP